jgi:hypothetical protein
MLVTNYAYAHKLVDKTPALSWDGWDIVEFKPDPDAYFMPSGIFKSFKWGFAKTFPITEEGWEIPNRYARG